MSWRDRVWEAKWHIVSGVLSVALTLWLAFTSQEPKPPPRAWPPGDMPQSITSAAPPEGAYRCASDNAPAPVQLRFCTAGPDNGLEICDARLVYVDGAPRFCAVTNCPPLPKHAQHYEVLLGCFLQSEGTP